MRHVSGGLGAIEPESPEDERCCWLLCRWPSGARGHLLWLLLLLELLVVVLAALLLLLPVVAVHQ